MQVTNISNIAELTLPPNCDYVELNFFRPGGNLTSEGSPFDEYVMRALEPFSMGWTGGTRTKWGLTVGMSAYDFGVCLKSGKLPGNALRSAIFMRTEDLQGFGKIEGYGSIILAAYCLDGTGRVYGHGDLISRMGSYPTACCGSILKVDTIRGLKNPNTC